MKKPLKLLVAFAMAAAMATGCGQAASNTATPAPTTTAAPTTAAPTTMAQATEAATAASTKEATSQAATTAATTGKSDYTLRVGSLKGPTSMGLVELMDKASKGKSAGSYKFTMVTAADELLSKMVSGDLDIALVPANMASIIYNKTNHGVNVIDINTLGVLYMVSSDESIKTIKDLKGKTLYLTGKGTTPDYVLQYLLASNHLTTNDVTLEYKSEPTEVAAILKDKAGAIGLLPQPFATVAMAQNDKLKIVMDLNKEWTSVQGATGGSLVTGVTICRGQVFEKHEDAVRVFMAEHQASAAYANEHVKETAQLVADAGIVPKAQIAEKALPYCSIVYIDGNTMKSMLSGYLSVLHGLDPKTVGGQLPGKDFYFIP